MTEETKGRENWVFAHIAWIASITWFALVAVKALRVSHMNSQTAIAILGSAEVVSVAFYVLVAVIPSLFLLGTMWTLNWIAVPSPNRTAPQKALGVCIVVLLSSVIVFIAPWFYPAIILVLLGVGLPAISLFRRWSRRRASRKPVEPESALTIETREVLAALEQLKPSEEQGENSALMAAQLQELVERADAIVATTKIQAAGVAERARMIRERNSIVWIVNLGLNIALVLMFLLSTTPWRPAERLTLEDRSFQIGYVVGEGDWTTVLLDHPRRIVKIDSSTIAFRAICSLNRRSNAFTQSVADLVTSSETPTYPRCEPKSGS